MRESCTSRSVRGARGNSRPYRNRRDFITLIGGVAAWPTALLAQQGERRQIEIWIGRPNDAEGQRFAGAFREALQALGWTNGRNVRMDYRWVTSDIDQLSLAKEIVEQRPDVIVAETTPAVAALSRVSGTIPIVFVNVGDPIGLGFVRSLAHPGGSVGAADRDLGGVAGHLQFAG
jgi:putative tryptophan/tyrosine transport system substrate-binding protein